MCIKKKNIKKKYIKKNTKNFYRAIISLFLAGFSTFAILYSIQPILPVFSRIFLLTPLESSFSLSVSTLSMAFGILFIGPVSNFFGRKNVMSISLFCASFFTILCAFSKNWLEIIIIRGLVGFSLSGVTSIAITYLSEEFDPKILSLCIGLYISGNTIGGLVGRLISNIIVRVLSWNWVFIIIGFFSLFCTILFIYYLPKSKNFKFLKEVNYEILIDSFYKPFTMENCLILFLVGFLFMGSFVALFNYIGYRLIMKPFLLHPIYVSLLSIIYLIGVYSSPQASFLSNYYGRIFVLKFALFIMILGVILTYSNFLFIILIGLIFFTTGFFIAHSTASSWISDMTKKYRLEISSLYFFFYYLGSSVFGSFSGFFWFYWGWSGVFFILNFILIICLFLMRRLHDD
ncbi:MFS transporter [Buchnera aphidicola]|uniref:MFS transporter n=1 Tax=Buchnera aphidicola TaxID=9 RepID=UPI002093299C|nr:MFS transporter [Buchnera aphidicola]USS94122.1 MFS transporter [Buchnera aphidicola (Sipha maydis)]WII23669.1 MFS transporter [Buchnera aphidicola (Sipha maydis)]